MQQPVAATRSHPGELRALAGDVPHRLLPASPHPNYLALHSFRIIGAPTNQPNCARILYMTTIPLAEARQNFSALVEQAVTTHQRILVTRNGAPAVWVIADDDLESIMETIDVL